MTMTTQAYSRAAILLDKIADTHGIEPRHVLEMPHLLAGTALDPEDVTPRLCREAAAYARGALQAIAVRHGGDVAWG